MQIQRGGSQQAIKGSPEQFTGDVSILPLFAVHPPARTLAASVTFEPCGRTDWHRHPLGQSLVVTSGCGFVQSWGGPVQVIRSGDVVWSPPGEKHWHGAAPDSWMTHIAVLEELDGKSGDWMEKVGDDQYQAAVVALQDDLARSRVRPTGGQKAVGDVAPKLAEITDDVLFADVWERPQLGKRDRSLVTCAALVATGKSEQMEFHFPRAIENGVRREEIVELITHLAFYAGWPNAMSSAAKARALFGKK
jgi:4-carboxymuconolactone decarboxylase